MDSEMWSVDQESELSVIFIIIIIFIFGFLSLPSLSLCRLMLLFVMRRVGSRRRTPPRPQRLDPTICQFDREAGEFLSNYLSDR